MVELEEYVHATTPQGGTVRVGETALKGNEAPVTGEVVLLDGEPFYRIANVDRMDPFFVTVVSASDHWLFVSSTGGLAAGRRSPEHALFPYETVDRIHDARAKTGSKTLFLVTTEGDAQPRLWEPFTDRYVGLYRIRRALYKSLEGDRLRFEEVNDDLGLTFTATWAPSERYGFVRAAALTNQGSEAVRVRLLDGVRNLMPYGVPRELQETRSVLADAYKRNERLDSGLGIFALSAQPVDRAEPSEALLATTVWQAGLDPEGYLLSTRQLDRFRRGEPVEDERLVRAERGGYFVHARLALEPGEEQTWDLVGDIEQSAADVVALDEALQDPEALRRAVREDVARGRERLRFLIGTADGEQQTGEPMTTARHRMNVLYNIMRGGVFDDGYTVRREDVRAFVAHHNAPLAAEHAAWFDALPDTLDVQALRDEALKGSPQLQRLVAQYLPLHFSRRHGDPSRPWNHYAIEVKNADGSIRRGYEGNWRDIFQNWEALGRSFPGYLESMVTLFVCASTADGYNPYRITSEGIDWEVIEPDDPWSYIGYWGDHQIIYLLRLLGQLQAHHPDRLGSLLAERRFSYANVPYRIASYASILKDPRDTVAFDEALQDQITERVETVGADGKLVWAGGEVHLVTLAEKLIVPLLAKLTNFVPGGGVWMNTQRPEWNDANNALVGYGISVVTLFAVRRYLKFLQDLLLDTDALDLSPEVADLAASLSDVFGWFDGLSSRPLSTDERKQVVDALGEAGTRYREAVYAHGLSAEPRSVPSGDVQALLARALAAVDQTLREARRDDGLVHSYNLLEIEADGLDVRHLYPMLEGQVAALDAGVLPPEEALALLRSLRQSPLYRADQHSYMLYPDRSLPGFLQKNVVPEDAVAASALLQSLLDAGDTSLVQRDVRGAVHFNGTFRNAGDLEAALDALEAEGRAVPEAERRAILDAFETVFDHHAFTGRSGTFFGYEGLGSIYWHMVSKLRLAAQETYFRAHASGADAATLGGLAEAYYDIRAGLGGSKTPQAYGAFPADAYSHTPGHAGAKQPGLTGQVKEDILCRWGELGVLVRDGRLVVKPLLLRADEFLKEPSPFRHTTAQDREQTLDLDAGALGFTLCATPFVLRRADALKVRLVHADGTTIEVEGDTLSREASDALFGRTGALARIEVDAPPAL